LAFEPHDISPPNTDGLPNRLCQSESRAVPHAVDIRATRLAFGFLKLPAAAFFADTRISDAALRRPGNKNATG
jgi:hypothetical protein